MSADEARCRIENLFAVGCEVNNVEPRIRQATSDITNLVVRVCNDQHAHSALDCASHGANQLVGLACPSERPDLRVRTVRQRSARSVVEHLAREATFVGCQQRNVERQLGRL